MENNDKAMEWFSKALPVFERVLGPEHPQVAVMYNNIAVTLVYQGECKEALEYLKKAIEIKEKVLGPEHPDTLYAYNGLIELWEACMLNLDVLSLIKHENMKAWVDKLIPVFEKVYGAGSAKTLFLYKMAGDVYNLESNPGKAAKYYALSADMYLEIYDKKTPQGENFISMFEKQFKAFIKSKGFNAKNPDMEPIYTGYASMLEKQGKKLKSLIWLTKANSLGGSR
jgi:tetratricopeptide (TPR) repeat protein